MSSPDSHVLPSPHSRALTCLPNYYRCSSGACVMDSWVCEDARDCMDGSDGEACPSPGKYGPSADPGHLLPRRGPLRLHPGWPRAVPALGDSALWPGSFSPQNREIPGHSEVIFLTALCIRMTTVAASSPRRLPWGL